VKTITFYSYKGGAGRTLALANAAVFAALGGAKVVALDFDLEAPGLGYKLFGKNVPPTPGLVGYLRDALAFNEAPDVDGYLVDRPIGIGRENGGQLKVMLAGRAPSANYFNDLLNLKLDQRLDDHSALRALEALKQQLKDMGTDVLLIDARTGITATNRVTTHIMADQVVALTLDFPEQLEGTRAVLQSIQPLKSFATGAPITLTAVVSRVPWNGGYLLSPSERDQACKRRVLSFLTEPAAHLERTLDLSSVTLLHHEPWLVDREYLCLEAVGAWVDTALHVDYRRLVEGLFSPGVIAAADRAITTDPDNELMAAKWTANRERIFKVAPLGDDDDTGAPVQRKSLDEKVRSLRESAATDSNRNLELFEILRELEVALIEVGDLGQSFTVTLERVDLARALVRVDPEKHSADLAHALHGLGLRNPKTEERTAAAEEAVSIYRALAQTNPKSYNPALANTLHTLGLVAAEPDASVLATLEAVHIFRDLAETNPERYLPELANTLHTLSLDYNRLGKPIEGINPAVEAVDFYRKLSPTNPDRYNPKLATTLRTLGLLYGISGMPDKAFGPLTEGERLRSQ
jgi:MinD-like ATPase involved in chromosome partitioning or flagellar assembly